MFTQLLFWAGDQSNHQNFDPSLLALSLIFMGNKQKKKLADSKKLSFSTLPILNISFQKFHGLVLGLVGLNYAKGIDVAQPIWS